MHSLKRLLAIDVIDEGKFILINELHPQKAPFSIKVTDGINISFNDLHFMKTNCLIVVTDGGISICCKDEHSLKTPSSITLIDEGIIICVKDVHI